jgi:phosphoglycolate phosphatase
MIPAYKLIIFDWDGTLMDSQARIVACLISAAHDLNLAQLAEKQLKHVIGLGLREAILELYPQLDDAEISCFSERYRYHFVTANETPSGLFSNVRTMLELLIEQGYMLAVATGKARRGLDQVLNDTGLKDCFHGSRCADETRSKPHPQMLEELLDDFGLQAHEAIMIGDTEYDLQMAHTINMDSLAVSFGVHEKSELLKHAPLACVDSIEELSHWLLNCNHLKL